jgi:[protein-PII] uridylyltransferase
LIPLIAEFYASESARLRAQFESSGDGCAALRERTALVDAVVTRLYGELFSPDLEDFCLVALGGYGRGELFPHSDIDLMFLSASGRAESALREAIATLSRTLWDLRLRVGHSTRTLSECSQLHRQNLEFNIALLDGRYLAGDRQLFERLHGEAVPHFVARDRDDLVRNLSDLIEQRHAKHGKTVYHLEPNIKDAPGGLRDFHVARWLTLIAEIESRGRAVEAEEAWPSSVRAARERAFDFLAALRCFLHYRSERDDNQLSYEAQDEAARRGIGNYGQAVRAADWMCTYFRHARGVALLTERLVEDIVPAHSSLYGLFKDWRSRLSNADFSVVRGRIYPRSSAASAEPRLLLDLFEMIARHGLDLSREGERWVEELVARAKTAALADPWPALRHLLTLPHAIESLRTMRRLNVLNVLLPELRVIDCLVIRDYFHRYTVDEHTLMTLQHLQELRAASKGDSPGGANEIWARKLGEVLSELERPDLLFFSLLLHDVGKGLPEPDHVVGSLAEAELAFKRLKLDEEEREAVRFLIGSHLEMSATLQRRDIFDPETVKAFAEKVGTTERLKMLTLFTYADVKAVSPEALTPWKAEMMWRLYVGASNYLLRSLDDERVRAGEARTEKASRVLKLLGATARREDLNEFLEGFPRRYLESRSAEDIVLHYAMTQQLGAQPVQVDLRPRGRTLELTVLTADRPFLFATITGTLAAWGMNILKADAFANRAGTVLDTFRFEDLHRTLELNLPEVERFKTSVVEVLAGKRSLQTLLKGRVSNQDVPRPKVRISTQVRFDNESSSHSTLLELLTQDRPGLLHDVSTALAEVGCNIEVALIDTEGQKVIDVFYLTHQAAKLDTAKQDQVREAMLARLERRLVVTAEGGN